MATNEQSSSPLSLKIDQDTAKILTKWLQSCEKQADWQSSGLGCDENWDCWQPCQDLQRTIYRSTKNDKE